MASAAEIISALKLDGKQVHVTIRDADGYVDATAICKAVNKKFHAYSENLGTLRFLKHLKELLQKCDATTSSVVESDIPDFLTPLSMNSVVHVSHGGKDKGRTWVHPNVAIHLAQWCSPEFAVAVTTLVLRYLQGKVTTQESVEASRRLSEHIQIAPENPRLLLQGPGVYIAKYGYDFGIQEEGVILAFGWTKRPVKRCKEHASKYEGCTYVDFLPTYDVYAEDKLRDLLISRSVLRKAQHKGKEVRELFIVKSQEEYRMLYNNMVELTCSDDVQGISPVMRERTKQLEAEARIKEAELKIKETEIVLKELELKSCVRDLDDTVDVQISDNRRTASVQKLDECGRVIETYNTMTQAVKNNRGASACGIHAVCQGLRRHAGGHRWQYTPAPSTTTLPQYTDGLWLQLDLDGSTVVNRFKTSDMAAAAVGVSRKAISHAVKMKTVSAGYRWAKATFDDVA